jgi:hypothetical protein
MPIDKIDKHYFLLNFLIRIEVQKPPKPPINDKQPVSKPCIVLNISPFNS